jgi:hexosaminidase
MPGKTQPDKDIIIDMWVTNDANSKIDQGYSFVNSNHGWTYIVPCTSIYGINNARVYEKWSPNYFNDKPGGTIPKDTPNLLGGKFHIWNDNGYQFAGYSNNEIARTAMPSLLVFSEKLWGRKGSDGFEAFQQRATAVFPGDDGFEFCPGSKSGHDARNPMLGSFPGTTFLNRHVPADGNGVVWKLDKPANFTPNNALKPDIENSPDHLAYPWTASFDITRFSDVKIGWYEEPHGHEILMDSKLCTLYLDYTYYDKLDKTTQLPTVRSQGVCLVRAARSAAPTPEQHLNRQVAYFDYEVPIGKQVNLTFVGHKGYTELYVDGELVKRVNQQCVCPLKSVGDAKWGKSFHGILHSAVIYNTVRAPAGNGHTENGLKKRQISDKNVQTLSCF